MPEAFVGVQVLRQFGGAGGGERGHGCGALPAMGGGMQGGMQGGMGGMGRVAAECSLFLPNGPRRSRITPSASNMARTNRIPRCHYKIVPVEEYSKDEQLMTALLSPLVGTKTIDTQVAQAAAGHLANKMSWEYLTVKRSNEICETDSPYFSPAGGAGLGAATRHRGAPRGP